MTEDVSKPVTGLVKEENTIDIKKALNILLSNWYIFSITILVTLVCAILYSNYKLPTYRVSATLLIDEEKQRLSMGSDQILEGFGLGAGMRNIDNQIMLLSSKALVSKTLDELDFDVEYYKKGPLNKIALYPTSPIKVIPEDTNGFPKDVVFKLKYLSDSTYKIEAKFKNSFSLDTISRFNESVKFLGGNLRIERESFNWPNGRMDRRIFIINHSRKKLVENYTQKLKVEQISYKGTLLRISLEGTNPSKDMDFINKLMEIFLNNSLDKKNQEAEKTIQFIDDQLIGISDSLIITENRLQQFRSQNKVMNLSAQGQVIIDQAMSLENEKARIEIEANYYNYLSDYLAKDNSSEAPIAPATMGITDPGLTKLVADLADYQGQLYSKSLGTKNPLQAQLAQRIRNTKEALKETLNGVIRANNLARNENLAQIHTINAQATALPMTERQLLGIQRKYKLNDELYTFLLEKRSVAQIQKASNIPDNEIIDSAEYDNEPVRPKRSFVYLLAILIGFGFPLSFILIRNSLDNKIRDIRDIKKLSNIPLIGHLTHNNFKTDNVVLKESRSKLAESFRSLRYKIQIYTKMAKAPIVLVSSPGPEEGKTFTSINLASVFSIIGKRTILVDFDLRKPKLHKDFNLENENGVSSWLVGLVDLDSIIKETSYENLFILPSGPIPPNPSELLSLKRTEELIALLKERFEYIIIDSSPLGIVSDTFHLASLADILIMVIRKNITLKNMLANNLKELYGSEIKSMGLVINDIDTNNKHY